MTPEDKSYNSAGQFVASRRPATWRAFAVLDPGGRIRTGILRMDSSLLSQLSYSGVVPRGLRNARLRGKMSKRDASLGVNVGWASVHE
jgi:hypothetical protein